MKTLHLFLFTFAFFAHINISFCQTTVTIGTGTTTQSYSPVYNYYNYNYTQQLYTSAEISAGGGVSGQMISSIAFYWGGTGNLTNCNVWDIYLGNTNQTSFTTTTWVPFSNLTLAYSGAVTLPSSAGWVTINLSNPLIYTGSNLVIAVDENVSGFGSTANFRHTTGTVTNTICYYSDATNPNPSSPPTASVANKNRPNVQLVFNNVSPCSGAPSPGNTVSSSSSVPSGSTVNLSLQNTTSGSGVTYQWQSSNDNSTWNNIASATNSTYTATVTANTYYRCQVTCSGSTTASNPIQINLTYCYSTSSSSSYYINNFSTSNGVSNISNLTSGFTTTGYANNSSTMAVSQYPGQAVNFSASLTGGTSGFGIWVDWNNDLDFADAGEQIYLSTGYSSSYSPSYTVPLTAVPGSYRMRIVSNYSSTSPTYCNSGISGETEDYTFTVINNPPCSGTPNPGNTVTNLTAVASGSTVNLSLANVTSGSGVSYQWQSSTDNINWSDISSAINPTYTPTITTNIYFRCNVTCSGATGTSNPVQITLTYCTPVISSVDGTGITNVSFGNSPSVSNTTGAESGNFGNYTSFIGGGILGNSITISITYSTGYTYGTKIWVDWNNDLIFDNTTELVYTGLSLGTNPTTLNASFTIPSNVSLGNYRMRIGGTDADAGPSTPCYSGTYASFEDYTLQVQTPPVPVVSAATVGNACAVSSSVLTISGTGLGAATNVSIGSTNFTTFASNTATTITINLTSSVSGSVVVTTSGGTSNSSSPISFEIAPVLTLAASSGTACSGSNSNPLLVSAGASDYDTYSWSPSSGVSGNATNGFVFTNSVNTTYTLTATQSNGSCSQTKTYSLTVKPLPTVNAGSDVSFCPCGTVGIGVPTSSNVTVLSEGFNAGIPTSWTSANSFKNTLSNTSSGNTWTYPGYSSYCTYFNSYTVSSGTTGALESPSFNLSNYSGAQASFWIYNSSGTDVLKAYVRVGTGADVQVGSASYGVYASWTQITIDLGAYVGNSSVKFIFKCTSDYGMSNIGIDDFLISGTQTIAYAWSNAGTLSNASVSNPTASPTSTTTYTLTATMNGCSSSDDVLVSKVDPVATSALTAGVYVWKGGVSGVNTADSAYNTASNWYVFDGTNFSTASSEPDYNDDVVISGTNTCVVNHPRTYSTINMKARKITIKNGGKLIFDTNGLIEARDHVTVETGGILDFQGNGILIVHNGDFIVNGTFNAGNGTVEFYNNANHDHYLNTSNANLTFYDLYITGQSNSVYDLHLLHDIQVQNVLSITSRKLNLNNYGIDLGTTGFIVNESNTSRLHAKDNSNYGNGYISATRNIPANTTIDPGNLGLVLTTHVNQMGNTVIKRYHYSDTVSGNTYNSTSRIFDVNPTYNGSDYAGNLDVDITFKYFDSELSLLNSTNLNESELKLFRSSDNGSTWEYKGGTIDEANNQLTFTGIEHFSAVTLSPISNLPVELLDITANCDQNGKQVRLNWSTATEYNASHFVIEKSRDAFNWTVQKEVSAAGFSTSIQNYQWLDENPLNGIAYYRLSQFDFDGSSKVYPLVSVNCMEENDLSLYPNPANDYVVIKTSTMQEVAQVQVEIIDAKGVVHYAKPYLTNHANQLQLVDLDLAPGVYVLKVHYSDTEFESTKLVIR